jgi:hypothetical protein
VSPIIEVEPEVYHAASQVIGSTLINQLHDAHKSLTEALSDTRGMAGTDPAGANWAAAYDAAAAATTATLTDLKNGCLNVSAMLAMTGFNHVLADSASDPGRQTPAPPDTPEYEPPTQWASGPEVPTAHGGSGSPPTGWDLVAGLVALVWPNGNPGVLRKAAGAWQTIADGLNRASFTIPEAIHAIRSQNSPEVDDAATVCQSMMDHIQYVAEGCRQLSWACRDLADHIDATHQAVTDELVSLLAWTAAIEAGGLALGIFSLGLAEGAAQGVEAARIAATASRISGILAKFVSAVETVTTGIASAVAKVAEVSQRLKAILGARVVAASTTEARTLPAIADAQAGAVGRLEVAAQHGASDAAAHPPRAISRRTQHAETRVLGRDGGHGVSEEALEDAVQHPTSPPEFQPGPMGGAFKYVGKDATVLLGLNGELITAWARNWRGWRNP